MSLGFDAIAALPFATSGPDTDVSIAVTGNSLSITIGSVGIIADAVTELVDGNQLTLGIGTVTIVGTANLEAPKTPLVLGTGNVTVTATLLSGPDVANGNADIASNPKLINNP